MDLRSVYYPSELAENIFTPFYRNPRRTKNKDDVTLSSVQQDFKNYTHEDAVDFAATSISWKNKSYLAYPELERSYGNLTFHSDLQTVRAYYRVIAEKPNAYILAVCHVNIHGHHRGDLRFIEINDRTITRGMPGVSVVEMLFLGDIVAVTEMALLDNFEAFDVFKASHDAQCVWMASRITVLPRNIQKEITFSMLENGTAVVKEQNEVMNVLPFKKWDAGKLYYGDAFLPEKMTFFFTEEHRSEHKNSLFAKCSKIHQYPNSLGTIYSFYETSELSDIFEIGLEAFKPSSASTEESESIVETCVLMGYAAAQSITNGRFDARPFPMYETIRNGPIVKFSIDNPPDKPTQGIWTVKTRIRICGPTAEVNAVIETVIIEAGRLKISALLSRDVPHHVKFNNGIHIVFQREAQETQILQKGFLKDTPIGSNGRRIIETLYGGNPISAKPIYNYPAYFYPCRPEPVKLNKYQCEYTDMILAGNPMVVGSSPFGCGKSMTIVTSALEKFKNDNLTSAYMPLGLPRIKKQLLVTQSNYATVNLVDIARKVHTGPKFVRYVSEKNWKELPEDCLTPLDLPTLMKQQFIQWAFGRTRKFGLENRHMVNMVCFLLSENLVEPDDFSGPAFTIYSEMSSAQKAKKYWYYDVLEAFFILYNPDIIMTTADSLQGLLSAKVLDKNSVATIQIDEASQVPEYTFISLLASFPNANYGLIGDIQQLPPYCEAGLEGKLKDYGIGNTMERAVKNKLFPQAMLREVYRCHPKTTMLLSLLFYKGKLLPGVQENQRNLFMIKRPDFWPALNFPILIVNNKARGTKMGTSCANKPEKDIVKKLLETLCKPHNGYILPPSDIGVISFYAAQTSMLTEALRERKGVKCGTVDAFQGSEREVIILCCTNDQISDFMQMSNRMNVAMSRAKQVTIVIGNLNGLKKAKYWSAVVRNAMENECVIEADHIGKPLPSATMVPAGLCSIRNHWNLRNNPNSENPVAPGAAGGVQNADVVEAPVEVPRDQEELVDQMGGLKVATSTQSPTELVAHLRMEKEQEAAKKETENMKLELARLQRENQRLQQKELEIDKSKAELAKLKEKEWDLCEICLQPYQQGVADRTPRILNCGHTFCQECAFHMTDHNGIRCPTCRVVTTEKADQLKTNYAIYKHV